jgi:hypothetical protein
VVAVQRRACQIAVEGGGLLILATPEVPLAPNALAVDVGGHLTLAGAGVAVGQSVALRAAGRSDSGADWTVSIGAAATWEPRPWVRAIPPPALAERLRSARATVVAEGAGASLLPLLWVSEAPALPRGPVRAASAPARLLVDAAVQGDVASVARAARGLAGLGPGLTPSGDDLLAGFAAAWTLLGESLGVDGAALARVTDALVAGAERGASPLGRAWLGHAGRGELLEPMTRFVAALLGPEPGPLDAAARGALAVGSSSGTDWMVGFFLGAGATLEAAGPGRPW